jgi:vacuolar-type H+-ATPase subunit F/Vma7
MYITVNTNYRTKKNIRTLVVCDDDEVDIEEDIDQTNENLVTPTVLTPTKKSDIEAKSILRNQCEKSPGSNDDRSSKSDAC